MKSLWLNASRRRSSLIDSAMPTSKEADLPSAIDTFLNPKQPILSYQSKQNAEAVGKLTDQQPAFEEAGKRRSKNGQWLDHDLYFDILQMKVGAAMQTTSMAISSKSDAGLGLQNEAEAEVRPLAFGESGERQRKNVATTNLKRLSTRRWRLY